MELLPCQQAQHQPNTYQDILIKPERWSGETLACYEWRVLRSLLRNAVRLVLEAEENDVVVSHGMYYVRCIEHDHSIIDVIHRTVQQDYMVYDGANLCTMFANGQQTSKMMTANKFNRLVFVEPLSLFICWTLGDTELQLMTLQFDSRSTSSATGPIYAVVYNQSSEEIVAAGAGFCGSWMFRYGGRVLLPRKLATSGLSACDCFTMLVLEETMSHSQRAFAVNGRSVAVFNLWDGQLLSYKSNLHLRSISAILFYNPLKYLVTAAKDGTIKVWDDEWHLQLVFIGHVGQVTCLAIYPHGPHIISAGTDKTIRVWSLETCDQLEKVSVNYDIQQLVSVPNVDDILAVCDQYVNVWRINNIHSLHTRIGYNIDMISCTDHPCLPRRAVLRCRDASVRIVNPPSGEVLTSYLATNGRRLISCAYAVSEDTLFVLFDNGLIVKADTCTNPCTVVDHWEHTDTNAVASECLLVYSYIISQKDGGGAARRATIAKSLPGGCAGRYKDTSSTGRTLLLGGRMDGSLCVYNWDNGHVDYTMEAHSSQGILNMTLYDSADQLITAGRDMVIKVWRVYAFAHETLSVLASIYCMQPALYTSVSNNTLSVAFQDDATATYSIVMYHLKTKDRYDHPSTCDHTARVTGLTSCNRLKIVASCSVDANVRIWNYANKLIRVIRLNAVPTSICFCSQRGDLLLGIGEHVYRIDYKKYLPRKYLSKILAVDFPPEIIEKSVEYDDNLLNVMNSEDIKRLKSARCTFKYTQHIDIHTRHEADELKLERKQREEGFAQLQAREQELQMIRDGQLTASKKCKSTPATKQEAFNKYIQMFYSRPKIELPKIDDTNEQELIKEKLYGKHVEEKPQDAFFSEPEPLGFFPPSERKRPACPLVTDPRYQLPPADGFIPNSVLVRLLFPLKPAAEKEADKGSFSDYRPPELSLSQLNYVTEFNKKYGTKTHSDSQRSRPRRVVQDGTLSVAAGTLAASAGTLPVAVIVDGQMEPRSDTATDSLEGDTDLNDIDDEWLSPKAQLMKEESGHKDRMAALLKKATRRPKSNLSQDNVDASDSISQSAKTAAAAVSSVAERDPAVSLASNVQSRVTSSQLQREMTSSSQPRPPPLPLTAAAAATTGQTQGQSRSARQLKEKSSARRVSGRTRAQSARMSSALEFVTRFSGREWFNKHFTGHVDKNSWSVDSIVIHLLDTLRTSSDAVRCDVLEAVSELLPSLSDEQKVELSQTLYNIQQKYNGPDSPPQEQQTNQQRFIRMSFALLYTITDHRSRDFYVELMMAYIDGDLSTRSAVLELFYKCGVRDTNGLFAKELETWDLCCASVDRTQRLRSHCIEFLEKWQICFRNHVRDIATKLQKGQTVAGRVMANQQQQQQQHHQQQQQQQQQQSETTVNKEKSSVSQSEPTVAVTLDGADVSAADNSTFVETINYFCEMTLNRQLLQGQLRNNTITGSDGRKNTIVSLPRLVEKHALVRLGDSYTSKCHPVGPRIALSKPTLGLLNPTITMINLPLKHVNVNPFPSKLDQLDSVYADSRILLILKTAPKYFVPSSSYVPDKDWCP